MATTTIPVPPEFIASMTNLMEQMKTLMEFTGKFLPQQPAEDKLEPPPAPDIRANIGSTFRRVNELFKKFDTVVNRNIDRLLNTLGPRARTFIRTMPDFTEWMDVTRLVASVRPASLTAGVVRFIPTPIALAFAAWEFLKWIRNRYLAFIGEMRKDFLESQVTRATIGGLRALRTTFGELPEDQQFFHMIGLLRANIASQQAITVMRFLGVKQQVDTADMIVDTMRKMREYMVAQPPGQELIRAQPLLSIASPEMLLALQQMSSQRFEELAKRYRERKPGLDIPEHTATAWMKFDRSITNLGQAIQNTLGTELVRFEIIQTLTKFIENTQREINKIASAVELIKDFNFQPIKDYFGDPDNWLHPHAKQIFSDVKRKFQELIVKFKEWIRSFQEHIDKLGTILRETIITPARAEAVGPQLARLYPPEAPLGVPGAPGGPPVTAPVGPTFRPGVRQRPRPGARAAPGLRPEPQPAPTTPPAPAPFKSNVPRGPAPAGAPAGPGGRPALGPILKGPSGRPVTIRTHTGPGQPRIHEAAAPTAGPHDSNWDNYLASIAYLESDYNTRSRNYIGATGAFQFIDSTARSAVRQGLPNPQQGTYQQQAEATRMWIERNKPEAARAIREGRFADADRMLNRTWTSLPGGRETQNARRYTERNRILQGSGTRPPGEVGAPTPSPAPQPVPQPSVQQPAQPTQAPLVQRPQGPYTPIPGKKGAALPYEDQKGRPDYYEGTIDIDGQKYRYATGGGSTPSAPYGTFLLTPDTPGGKVYRYLGGKEGAINIEGGTIWDPLYNRNREGIYIHHNLSNKELETTAGCLGINRRDWPKFLAMVRAKIAREGPQVITIEKGGAATIHSANSSAPVSGQPNAAPAAGQPTVAAPPGLRPEPPPPGQPHLLAPSGQEPTAVIIHHTNTGPGATPGGIVSGWRTEGPKKDIPNLGAQIIIDRQGVPHYVQQEFGYNAFQHVQKKSTPDELLQEGIENQKIIGIEVMAKNDKDITPAQIETAKQILRQYPNAIVAGHGAVNPGHKERTEGKTIADAINAERAKNPAPPQPQQVQQQPPPGQYWAPAPGAPWPTPGAPSGQPSTSQAPSTAPQAAPTGPRPIMYGFKGVNGAFDQPAFEKYARSKGYEPVTINAVDPRSAAAEAQKDNAARGGGRFGVYGFSLGAQSANALMSDPEMKKRADVVTVIGPYHSANLSSLQGHPNLNVYPDASSGSIAPQGEGRKLTGPHMSGPAAVTADQTRTQEPAQEPTPPPSGDSRLTEVGNYRLGGDQRRAVLMQAAGEASKSLPPGWRVEAYSGQRTGGAPPHQTQAAVDFRLIDPQGHEIPNYQDPRYYAVYERFAQNTHLELEKINPELARQHRWGGYFSGAIGPGGKYGAMDLMHQDFGGGAGRMAAGNFQTGISPEWQRRWGVGQTSGTIEDARKALQTGVATRSALPENTTAKNSPHPPAPEDTKPKDPAGWKKQDEKLKPWPKDEKKADTETDKGSSDKADSGADKSTSGKGKSKVDVDNKDSHANPKDEHVKLAGSLHKGLKVDNRSDYNVSLESSGAI